MILCPVCRSKMDNSVNRQCSRCGWIYTPTIARQIEAINIAKYNYNESIKTMKSICEKANYNQIETEVMLKIFDYGLQSVLYSMSIQYENSLNHTVLDVILNLTENGDIFKDNILDLTIPTFNSKLKWELLELPTFGKNEHQKVINYIEQYVIPTLCIFIDKIIEIDKATGLTSINSTLFKLEVYIIQIGVQVAIAAWSTDYEDATYKGTTLANVCVNKYFSTYRRKKER